MSFDEHKEPLTPTEDIPSSGAEAPEDRFSAFDQPVRPDDKKKSTKKPLNPRMRTLFIALGAVVLLTAILLLVLYLPRGEQPGSSGTSTPTEITYPLIEKGTSEDTGTVTSLQVKNSHGSYTLNFDSNEKVYTLAGYEDLTLDSSTVQGLTEAAMALSATAKLGADGSPADYGLDKPATVTAVYKDGTSHTLRIGSAVPSGSGCALSTVSVSCSCVSA